MGLFTSGLFAGGKSGGLVSISMATEATISFSTEALIEVVKGYPFITDKKHPYFKNWQKKDAAWHQIGVLFGVPGTCNIPLMHVRRFRSVAVSTAFTKKKKKERFSRGAKN